MKIQNNYVMREQVDGLIPSLMKQRLTPQTHLSDKVMSLLSVGVVTFVYLLAMTLAAD
ncbi:MAG: hypothetical protein KDI68_12685 [Gammaproteobacteria bacterium]|nr:hypothetical protein [Gammaproteobacteria bacterium]